MTPMFRNHLFFAVALWVFASLPGCKMGVSDFTGKGCEVAADCPEPYSCVETGPNNQRTCELIRPPEEGDITPVVTVEADWCNDVKPLMFKYCVECHGGPETTGTTGSGRTDFHLGYYARASSSGAQDFAERIDVRMVKKSPSAMPPITYGAQPTPEELERVKGWVAGGAPYTLPGAPDCADDGVAPATP